MKDNFNTTYKSLISEEDNTYSSDVSVSVYLKLSENEKLRYDYDSAYKTNVKFTIDIEARSWGIKSINVNIIRINPIVIELKDADTDETIRNIRIQIDPSQLNQYNTKEEIKYIGIGDMDISADANGIVDYKSSTIVTRGL